LDEYLEAKEIGVTTRPVVIGPVSFLYLGKAAHDSPNLKPLDLLDALLPVYKELFKKFAEAGVEWIQIDEPILAYDLPEEVKAEFKAAYDYLATADPRLKLLFTTYFGSIVHNLDIISSGLQIQGLHVDLVRAPEQLDEVITAIGPKTVLSVGVVDGRNIWKTDLKRAIDLVQHAVDKLGKERVFVSSSSSLLHTPYTVENEKKLPADVKSWFSFAVEKCKELSVIANVINHGPESEKEYLENNAKAIESRRTSSRTNDPQVKERFDKITPDLFKRKSEYPTRKEAQTTKLHLPLFPTTTIGSFPQTKEIRQARNKLGKKEITEEEYEKFIEKEIEEMIKFQEEVGLDVFVHGEPERNDMVCIPVKSGLFQVQYFGERLKGFVFTQNGWVQSFGSRYVRPPIVVGDVSRPQPMTVKESKYAVSLTKKPSISSIWRTNIVVKGMLTGPITILRWSFPRDDVPQSVQAKQLGLALRDEVSDLEKAGISVIQVDGTQAHY
jgi:5-methyltetrahydropteroyltriglutamate--homocysteine methyltransferase